MNTDYVSHALGNWKIFKLASKEYQCAGLNKSILSPRLALIYHSKCAGVSIRFAMHGSVRIGCIHDQSIEVERSMLLIGAKALVKLLILIDFSWLVALSFLIFLTALVSG